MSKHDITMDEWAAELDRLSNESAEGMTVRDIATSLRISLKLARDKVRRAMDAGLCEYAGLRRVTRIDGKPTKAPVYRFKRRKKGGRMKKR